jgi:predicted transcriptional regulator
MWNMSTSITIRFDERLAKMLRREARRSGQTSSEIVRDAVRRQLAVREFQNLRKQTMPFAEAAGYLTDEDVFRDVS